MLYNTGLASDGTYELEITGRNALGVVIATAQRAFVIDNQQNSLNVISPQLTHILHGIVPVTALGSDALYYPAVWQVLLDGQVVGIGYTDNSGKSRNTVTVKVDTRIVPNGKHELYIGMHSDFWPTGQIANKSFYNWRGGFDRVIKIDNGHTLMNITANYLHVYLQPGHIVVLKCKRHFTDLTTAPCVFPSYASSDTNVLSVAADGTVTAGANEGFATITVSEGTQRSSAYVWVKTTLNVAHFAGNGQFLSQYKPGQSLFVIAPFELSAGDVKGPPNILDVVQQSGINTISEGFYVNPRDVEMPYSVWQQYYDAYVAPDWTYAAAHNLHILAVGDEVCRTIGNEAWWTLNWPYGEEAVKHAFQSLASSGVAISVDMVDEASGTWGSTPTPAGLVGGQNSFTSASCDGSTCTIAWPSNPVDTSYAGTSFALTGSLNIGLNTLAGKMFTASNVTSEGFDFTPSASIDGDFSAGNDPGLDFLWWAGNRDGCPSQPCDPPVRNDALAEISGWLHTGNNTVPISWPPLALSPPPVQANWMGPGSLSDYASHYWTSYNERAAYTWSQGVQEATSWIKAEYYARQPSMMLDRPQLMEVSLSGAWYYKGSPTTEYYTPPVDVLNQPGVTGPVIVGEMMTEAALGVAGERLYMFESAYSLNGRLTAPVGALLQTGANPTVDDPSMQENWQAMSYAAKALTTVLAPYLLGAELDSPAYGPNIVTAARQGDAGRMLLIVNGNDWHRRIEINFAPFTYGGRIERVLVSDEGIATGRPANAGGETIRLEGGESVAYLFYPGK
ncbi:MAG TPA: hypothetical protein VNE63_12600 [Candidatus Acidoferrales bacterium]|nr:hypothetical protein [Candidatus Acidoferrales bacterium]